jgi:tRNA G18 (ribose-2'-O)-methylase SpoU
LADQLPTRATLVVCPEIHNPENLGGLLRTCHALGVDAVILGEHCADPFSRRVVRVSMGAVLELPILEAHDLKTELPRLCEQSGLELVASVLDSTAQRLECFRRPQRVGLMLGNEAHGLDAFWLANCQHRVTIPMRHGADSLNLVVASGILLDRLQHSALR